MPVIPGYYYCRLADRLGHPEAFDYALKDIDEPMKAQFYVRTSSSVSTYTSTLR